MNPSEDQNNNPVAEAEAGSTAATSNGSNGITTTTTTTTTSSGSYKTNSVAILVGNPQKNNHHTVNVVVWACHKRNYRNSQSDPWKYVLEYYEFLEDTSCWTNLDQLLLNETVYT